MCAFTYLAICFIYSFTYGFLTSETLLYFTGVWALTLRHACMPCLVAWWWRHSYGRQDVLWTSRKKSAPPLTADEFFCGRDLCIANVITVSISYKCRPRYNSADDDDDIYSAGMNMWTRFVNLLIELYLDMWYGMIRISTDFLKCH